MAASLSAEPVGGRPLLDEQARALLLDIADDAIVAGLDGKPPRPPALSDAPPAVREPCGLFVTLLVDGELNGCIGSVIPREPLGEGAARYAFAAAFEDPRLPPLRWRDYDRLDIEISVLSPLERMDVDGHLELVAALRPGVDGLYLSGAGRASAFLPSVWEQLPDPDEFVRRLQLKAGLPAAWWPPDMAAFRFTATKFGRRAGARSAARRP